ncbi:LysR family transcriptional regulator [Bradyrhizobium jicamae]|uniref:LysR family transcriptional regulator n=1 Tax=Bradyrhizobium jicamae TaxID=280332 RepID=A0ABS5FF45_9BRAD|nr:LysR family transcriptional regulator [Bradyrhizobium jicamae]MBR0795294.1 LysR family transcriptional regulator [Bradyrhizobium jicamae]MBR0932716.1 LysR family transcriptional regulator [Bradyrhizobium jicamae]
MISLENIRIFMRAAEAGSFSAAGRSLRMSPSVISYRIQALETHLNCRLVSRTTRRMNLTEAGRVFYERCLDIVESVERAEVSVTEAGATPRGTLKVTAPLGLGRRVISALAARYREEHTETDIHLRLSDHLLDLVQESVDVAIRLAQLRDSTFTLRKIADIERVLCASPAYLEQHGTPQTASELLRHSCLLLRFPGSQQFRWTLMVDHEFNTLPVSGRLDADDCDVLIEWALAGQGIVMMPLFEVAGHIASGRLVPVLPDAPPQPVTLGVLYPTRKMLPLRVKAFVDMSVEGIRRHVSKELAIVGKKL